MDRNQTNRKWIVLAFLLAVAALAGVVWTYGYRQALDQFEGAIVLLIADDEGHRAALLIDEILDQRQVVIKGLNDSFYRPPGVAAATILGDGQIALILDPSDIIALTLSPQSAVTAA